LTDLVDQAQVDDKSKLQLRFYARQFIDAMSPSNLRSITNGPGGGVTPATFHGASGICMLPQIGGILLMVGRSRA
jgi:hypothetical protein